MFKRKRTAEDFAEEIKAHLALEADDLRGEGLSEAESQRRARVEFGNVPLAQEKFRLRGRWQSLDKIARDFRFGVSLASEEPRALRSPRFSLWLSVWAPTLPSSAS